MTATRFQIDITEREVPPPHAYYADEDNPTSEEIEEELESFAEWQERGGENLRRIWVSMTAAPKDAWANVQADTSGFKRKVIESPQFLTTDADARHSALVGVTDMIGPSINKYLSP